MPRAPVRGECVARRRPRRRLEQDEMDEEGSWDRSRALDRLPRAEGIWDGGRQDCGKGEEGIGNGEWEHAR